jgi:hypothetical protein
MKLRSLAKSKGYKLNQYGLWDGEKRIDNNTEKGIYKELGVMYVSPEDRIDGSEIKPIPRKPFITKWPSGDGKREYTIIDDKQCNCKGFVYRGKCRHLKELQKEKERILNRILHY